MVDVTPRAADSELLSLDRAADRLGWTDTRRAGSGGRTNRAQRLLEAILAREAEAGAAVLTRLPKRERTTLRVTVHALREHLPELFPGAKTRASGEGAFRSAIRSINGRIDARHDALANRLAEVAHAGQVTREMVVDLTETVGRLADEDPFGALPSVDPPTKTK